MLSQYGRDDATTRWYEGDRGPSAPIAQAAPAPCSTCGYLVPLAGQLRSVFGVCANAWSPDDGQVVSYDHGCGAHSEAIAESVDRSTGETVIDTVHFDPLEHDLDEPGEVTSDADVEIVGEMIAEPDGEASPEVDGEASPEVDAEGDAKVDVGGDAELDVEGDTDADVEGHTEVDAEVNVEGDTEVGPA